MSIRCVEMSSAMAPDVTAPGGADFARMIGELRRLQDRVAEGCPPADVVAATASGIAALADSLARYSVVEEQRIAGRRWDLDGRGQAFVPPVRMVESGEQRRVGRVCFSASHHGAGGVVHGGVIPLVFVEVLGLLANSAGRPLSRMAYLNVDFKAPIRVGVEVGVDAEFARLEGRKIFIRGSLFDEQVQFATAEALFVLPRESAQ